MYKTIEERVIVHILEQMRFEVVNPSDHHYQRAYKDRRKERPNEDPMAYWLKLVRHCHCCVFSTFPHDLRASGVYQGNRPRVSARVFREVDTFLDNGLPVHWVAPEVRSTEDVELKKITGWGNFHILTVAKTQALLLAAQGDATT